MDLKSMRSSKAQRQIEEDATFFQKLESRLKHAFFSVIHVMLRDTEISLFTYLILAIIQFFQLLSFNFHPKTVPIWNYQEDAERASDFFRVFLFTPYLENLNYIGYIAVLYILVGLYFILLIVSALLAFAIAKKKNNYPFLVTILKYTYRVLVTILYLPILEYFLSISNCVENFNGDQVHYIFTERECWSGSHLTHAIVGLLMMILFIFPAFAISLTYFERRGDTNEPTARINARAEFLVLIYETVMAFTLTFLNGDQFDYVWIGLMLIGTAILFLKFMLGSPFHKAFFTKVWSTLTALCVWTSLMLFAAKIFERNVFGGSLVAWGLGIPFTVLYVIAARDNRINLLLLNVNKFKNATELQDQIRFIISLISLQERDRRSAVLLDGYIELHKQNCNKEDCPLKNQLKKNNRVVKSILNNAKGLPDKYIQLIHNLYLMFFYGIKKFPNATTLRISYAFFLVEKMKHYQLALQELMLAEQNKPPFDEQFVIYNYKKVIEDILAEIAKEEKDTLNILKERDFNEAVGQFQAAIEKSSLLHMEFWSQLSEENPDLGRLNDIGARINSSIIVVENLWKKIIKVNPNSAKIHKIYGRYLMEVVNDKESAEDFLQKAQKLLTKSIGINTEFDSTPFIVISGESDKLGVILNMNLPACALFEYNRQELLNKKVNVLMPQMYSNLHDQFLDNYINNNQSEIIQRGKERLVYGKTKAGYIFPTMLTLKIHPTINNEVQFMGSFRQEKTFKNVGHVLTSIDGTIQAISSSCINILKMDNKIVAQKKANIEDLNPSLIRERLSLFNHQNKHASQVDVKFFNDSEYLSKDENRLVTLNCQLSEINFFGGKTHAGLAFKFQRILDKTSVVSELGRRALLSNFQFNWDLEEGNIQGGYVDLDSSQMLSEDQDGILASSALSKMQKVSHMLPLLNLGKDKEEKKEEEKDENKIDYAEGIKTMKLFDGRVVNIDYKEFSEYRSDSEAGSEKEQKKKEGGEEDGEDKEKDEEEEAQEEGREFSTIIQSKKKINEIIKDRRLPAEIKGIKCLAYLFGMAMALLAIIDFAVGNQDFEKIENISTQLDLSYRQTSELMNVLAKTRDLNLVRIGLITHVTETELRTDMEESLQNILTIKNQLDSDQSLISTTHFNLLNSPSIIVKESDGTQEEQSLSQATDQVVTRATEVSKQDLSEQSIDDADFYFVTYNLLNELYIGLKTSSDLYASELNNKVDSKTNTFQIMLIISAVLLILAVMLLYPFIRSIENSKKEILQVFLHIPEKAVKVLYDKAENYYTDLQVGDDDGSNIDEEEEDLVMNKDQKNEDSQEFTLHGRRKKFKNTGRSYKWAYVIVFAIGAFFEAYYIYNFLLTENVYRDVKEIIGEYNVTASAESFYYFANNAQKQLFIDETFPVYATDAETITVANIKQIYELDSLISKEHSQNINIHENSYNSIFNEILFVNPCPLLEEYVSQATCNAFAENSAAEGMTVLVTRYFENLRNLLTAYTRFKNGETWDYSTANYKSNIVSNSTQNDILNLMNLEESIESDTIQELYIRNSFRILMDQFNSEIQDNFDGALTIKVAIFVLFLVFLLIVDRLVWFTLYNKLANEVWKTKIMLTMIPAKTVANNPSIRKEFLKILNQRSA